MLDSLGSHYILATIRNISTYDTMEFNAKKKEKKKEMLKRKTDQKCEFAIK